MQALPDGSHSTATADNIELNVRRRRIGRADGLEHLVASHTHEDGAALESKREIVAYLVHIHMLAIQLFKCEQRHYVNQSAAGEHFRKSLTAIEHAIARKLDGEREALEEEDLWQDDRPRKPPGVFDVSVSMQSAGDLTVKELDLILSNTRPSALYDYFLLAQKRLFELSQKAVTDCGSQTINGKVSYRYDHETFGIKNFLRFRLEANDNMEQLVSVLKTLKSLRNCVGKAAESSRLTKGELQALKIKLTAFDRNSRYSNATRLVFYTMEYQSCLTNARSERWWDIGDYDAMRPVNSSIVSPESPASTPHAEQMRSTLTFVVPIVSLLSFIPAAIAWKHGDTAVGTAHDSDFWQTVSSSILQLLSLITFIWPTLKDPGLSQLTWVWIWILAGFSAICAIISVPVYLVEPTILSYVISFAGSLAQAVVQLQVVNAI